MKQLIIGSMCDNQSASVKKCTLLELNDCNVVLIMQTDTFDVRIVVLFLYLLTNDLLL